MALVTIVRDCYTLATTREIATALDELAEPGNTWYWSSSGIYCFWCPRTSNILYLGLAKDLKQRFNQHNKSGGVSTGDKREKIRKWFTTNDRLGYSVILQSPTIGDLAPSVIADGEGQLLEGYRLAFGSLPPWNEKCGAVTGAKMASSLTKAHFDLLSGVTDSLAVSRRTLRELSSDDIAIEYELSLHTARLSAALREGLSGGYDDVAIRRHLAELHPSVSQFAADQLVPEGYLTLPAPLTRRPA